MSSTDELILLERVFLRVGSASTDEQLEHSVSKFLPPLLLKVSSPTEAVRSKVMELLTHINKRIKSRNNIQLPVESLLVQYQDPEATAFITNFTIIYIKLGFPRLPEKKQADLLPTLVHAANGKPLQHQESLLLLLIGSLHLYPLPKNPVEGKSVLGLSEKPKLFKLFQEFVMDLLIFNYGSSTNNYILSQHAVTRLISNLPWIESPDKLEQLKLTLIKFISCGILTENQLLIHLVIATADPRSTVSDLAETQHRKITGSLDLDSLPAVSPLYTLFLGSGEGEKEKIPAGVRLRLKLLPHMTKFRVVIWPAAIKVLFESLYGQDSNPKLKSLGLSFCSNIIHHVPVKDLSKVAQVILEAGLVKLITDPSNSTMLHSQAYSVMGQLVGRVSTLANINFLRKLFVGLSQEEDKQMQTTIRDALIVMSSAFKSLGKKEEEGLVSLLEEMLKSNVPKVRAVAVHYIANTLPWSASQMYMLLSAATQMDEEVISEAKKALYGPNYKTASDKVSLVFPSFTELLSLIVEKESGRNVNTKLHNEILFYLRLCLANSAGIEPSVNQIAHPSESSAKIGNYLKRLHETEPLLLQQYLDLIYTLLNKEPGAVTLESLVEIIGCLADISMLNSLRSQREKIKALINSTNEEVRCASAQLLGFLREEEDVRECLTTLESGGKDFETIHGSLLTLGHMVERSARIAGGKPSTLTSDPRIVKAVVKYLTHSHSMLISGACMSLGLMGQAQGLPVAENEKYEICETLLKIALEPKYVSKVKDRACNTLGLLCIGEDFPPSETIIKKILDSAKEVQDIELHLSTGDTLVDVVLSKESPKRQDPWTRGDLQVGSKVGDRAEQVASNLLCELLSKRHEPHPHLRQSCCIWLLAMTKHCENLNAVKSRLQEIQSAFMDFLSDNNSLVQEAAGKGLALVFQSGDSELKKELLKKVVEQLTSGKRSVNRVTSDTKLFEEGELGKTPMGGNLTTYKELCALASDLNKPDLIYKFMHIVNHNSIWNSKKGAAYGVGSLVSLAGEEMETQLPSIVAKLYRYQYDPTPSIQQAMVSIWHSVTSSTSNVVEKYHKEIFDDLLLNLTAGQWRVRISCCQALSDFLRGGGSKVFEENSEKIGDLWKILFRVMDDIHEGTREAAANATNVLSKICIRHCEKEIHKSSKKITSVILPILMETGIKHQVSEIRTVSISTVSEIVRGGVSPDLVPSIVIALLTAAAELESTTLNAISMMVSSSSNSQEAVDSYRASAVKSHFTVQTLSKVVQYVKGEMLPELVPQMTDMLKSSVGLGSRVATSHFIVILSHHLRIEEIQPYIGKFLGALLNGLKDRNAAIRKTCATTIGQLTKYGKDSSVSRLVTNLKNIYFEKEDEHTRSAVCYTFQAMTMYSPDKIKNVPELTLPIVFFAMHEKKNQDGSNKRIIEIWEEVWEEVCSSIGTLDQNKEAVCLLLEECMQSQAWNNKAQAARAIKSLCSKLSGKLGPEWEGKLLQILIGGLPGKTWDGKESLLDALSSLTKNSQFLKASEQTNLLAECLLKEAKKNKISYRIHSLNCLSDVIKTLEVDRFEEVHEICMDIINLKSDMEVDESASNKKENSEMLRETAFLTLGKVWPSNKNTQGRYFETVIKEMGDGLGKNTWNVEVAILMSISEIMEKSNISKDNSNILSQVYKSLDYALGISKNIRIRKEALNLLFILTKILKKDKEAEVELKKLKDIFLKFSQAISKDNAPEIKSRYLDLKDQFEQIERC